MTNVSIAKIGHWLAGLVLLVLMLPSARAQAPAWQMAIAANQNGTYAAQVSATTTDASGNVYITGNFSGTASFGTITLTSAPPFTTAGNSFGNVVDVFVAKWSPVSNDFVWSQRAGGGGYDAATAIAVTGANVYIAGAFSGPTATFGNNTLVNTTNNGSTSVTYNGTDVFVAKLTDAGTTASFAWAQRASGTSNEVATGLAVSGANVYVCGWFSYSVVTFGPATLTNFGPAGQPFIAKLLDSGTTGSFVWAQQADGPRGATATAVAVNGPNVYLTGHFDGATTTFGPFTLTNANPAVGSAFGPRTDIFVAKLTDAGLTGSFTWAQQAGGIGFDQSLALAVNGANVYIAGYYGTTRYSLNGNLGNTPAAFGSTSLPSIGEYDAFVAKLADAGATASFVWAQRAGGTGIDSATAITVRGNAVYVAGAFSSDQIGFGATTLTKANGASYYRDVFVARLTDAGSTSSFDWAQQAGGSTGDFATSVSVAGTAIYVGGAVGPQAAFSSQSINSSTGQIPFLASLPDPTLTATTVSQSSLRLTLYPNPAHTAATVQLPAVPGATTATLTLTDALGLTLRTETVPLPAAGRRHELDLRGLAPGLYAVQVQAGNTHGTQRLVVE